jgi:YaiO family outer membrane protein
MQKSVILVILLLSIFFACNAQKNSIDNDGLYLEARELAYHKLYVKARNKARIIVQNAPNYHDARILIARTFAWESQFDSARLEINKVLEIAPDYRDASNAAADIEYWAGNNEKALELVNKELVKYPDDKELLQKKAQILMAMGREKEAREILANIIQQNPYNYEVIRMLSGLKKYKNRLIFEHTLDIFEKPYAYALQTASIQYQRDATWGTWVGKVNAASLNIDHKNLGSDNDFQLETDVYPRLTSNSYLYLNYGFSPSDLFPTHRAGIEYFRCFHNGWEGSVGGRYMYFENSTIKHTLIATGSIGKYFSNHWFSFRPYLIFNHEDIAKSYYLFYRYYFNNVTNYIGCALGYGISPDEAYNKLGGIYQTNMESYRIRFDFQHYLGKRIILRVMVGNSLDEYNANAYRYHFDSNFYLAWLF